MLSITQMKYILAVDRLRHFGRAASSCNVTQPSLSVQIQKAEELLNVVVFDRSKSPILLTKEGETVVNQARNILFEYNKMFDLINENKKEVKGEFILGVIPTLSPYVVPLFIENFCSNNSEVKLHIEEMKTEDIIKNLKDDKIDGGLLVTPLSDDQIIERSLFFEPFYAYASDDNTILKKNKVLPTDVKSEGLWILNEGHCFRDQVLNLCDISKSYKRDSIYKNLIFESGNLETLKRIVDNGTGHTILPYLSTNNFSKIEKNRLREFEGNIPTREVSLVHSRIFLKESIINSLEKSIIDSAPKELRSLKSSEISIINI